MRAYTHRQVDAMLYMPTGVLLPMGAYTRSPSRRDVERYAKTLLSLVTGRDQSLHTPVVLKFRGHTIFLHLPF